MKIKSILAMLLCIVFTTFTTSVLAQVLPIEPGNTVLLLDTTAPEGLGSLEAKIITELGFIPQIITETEWSSMQTADFARFRAVILGDPLGQPDISLISVAELTTNIWGPAINGNVVIYGTDPSLHASGLMNNPDASVAQAAEILTYNMIDFVTSVPTRTGSAVSLSSYYADSTMETHVPVLDAFSTNGFNVLGSHTFDYLGLETAVIDVNHPVTKTLTNDLLSDWGTSIKEVFTKYPSHFQKIVSAVIPIDFYAETLPYILVYQPEVPVSLTLNISNVVVPAGTTVNVAAHMTIDDQPYVGYQLTFMSYYSDDPIVYGEMKNVDSDGNASVDYVSYESKSVRVEIRYTNTQLEEVKEIAFIEWTVDPIPENLVCNAGEPDTVDEGLEYTLNGSATGGVGVIEFYWTPLYPLSSMFIENPTFTAPEVDVNTDTTWELLVADEEGQEAECSTVITILDVSAPPPVIEDLTCSAGGSDSIDEGLEYTLNGSTTGGTGTISYMWEGPYTLNNGLIINPTFTAPEVDVNTETAWKLTVSDEGGQTSMCSVNITINDTDVPTPIEKLQCDAGVDDSINEGSDYTLTGSATGGTGVISYSWNGPYMLDNLSISSPTFQAPQVDTNTDTLWELTVSDEGGQVVSCGTFITIIDTSIGAQLDCDNATASRQILWPDGTDKKIKWGKYAPVSITGVTDTNDESITILGVTQDEALTKKPGAKILGSKKVSLLITKDPLLNGRVYEVSFRAKRDAQECIGSVFVTVPIDNSIEAIDDGQLYDSTLRVNK